jgi:hypothetical protein
VPARGIIEQTRAPLLHSEGPPGLRSSTSSVRDKAEAKAELGTRPAIPRCRERATHPQASG